MPLRVLGIFFSLFKLEDGRRQISDLVSCNRRRVAAQARIKKICKNSTVELTLCLKNSALVAQILNHAGYALLSYAESRPTRLIV